LSSHLDKFSKELDKLQRRIDALFELRSDQMVGPPKNLSRRFDPSLGEGRGLRYHDEAVRLGPTVEPPRNSLRPHPSEGVGLIN